ncbi:MAG: Mur ligase domain-containing protein, partial [Actinomycetota bacterium]|nr:Mur ligase domain-containing protein [Actinomycetota bacterium]
MNGTSLTEIVAHSGGQLVGRQSSNSDQLRVFGISHDSRGVRNNDLFACIPGEKHDGHLYATEAVKAGASALLVERELDSAVPQIIVPNVRKALGPIAATING